jgi:hypothetical protein
MHSVRLDRATELAWQRLQARDGVSFTDLVKQAIEHRLGNTTEGNTAGITMEQIDEINTKAHEVWAAKLHAEVERSEAEQRAFAEETERKLNEALGLD